MAENGTKTQKELYEEELTAHRRNVEVSAELLKTLHESAQAGRGGDVHVPAETLLRLLDHIAELRSDLAAVHRFIDDSEKEEEGYSPAVWAWNQIIEDFRAVPRLYAGDLTVIPEPLIDRLDRSETTVAKVEGLVRRQINGYGNQTMVKAATIRSLLTDPAAE